ncbi:MAG: hypothetical protein KJZ75_11375 [Hyphomonadaceae bacterium]|nr:hypothetical protein [Hyphomonadaceae bacterium]
MTRPWISRSAPASRGRRQLAPRAGTKRKALIEALRDGEKTTAELASLTAYRPGNLAGVLRILEAKRLVECASPGLARIAGGMGESFRWRLATARRRP